MNDRRTVDSDVDVGLKPVALPRVLMLECFYSTVALKAVGLPEEGTLRIGGRRERLRRPACPFGMILARQRLRGT